MTTLGIDQVLILNPSWKSKRIGLVTNQAAVTSDNIPSRKALIDAGFNIVRLFSPEHGIAATGEDGAPIQNGIDGLTGLPVISLYGNNFMPSSSDLGIIDLLLFDIPDAGVRFYTYLWTMTYCLEACAKEKKPFILLDRPNPISGEIQKVEGPYLNESSCGSFVGRWNIPIRHSCTFGELATYFNTHKKIGCAVEIITCQHWSRAHYQSDTGLHFIPTSPAIHNEETLIIYPGTCFLEATNLYEGRGGADAFKLVGAPWLKTQVLIDELRKHEMGALHFTTDQLISGSKRFNNELCKVVKFSVLNQHIFKPVQFGLLLIKCILETHPEFEWDLYPTAANPTGEKHLDKLLGIPQSEKIFDLPWKQFLEKIEFETNVSATWFEKIKDYLLY